MVTKSKALSKGEIRPRNINSFYEWWTTHVRGILISNEQMDRIASKYEANPVEDVVIPSVLQAI